VLSGMLTFIALELLSPRADSMVLRETVTSSDLLIIGTVTGTEIPLPTTSLRILSSFNDTAERERESAAGGGVREEIVQGDRQGERAAGSGVAEQTVQAERQGDTAAGGRRRHRRHSYAGTRQLISWSGADP
jgi:hypothetical protein